MPGEESYIQVPADAGGRKIRTTQVTKAGNIVQEEVVRFEALPAVGLPAYAVCALDSAVAASKHHLVFWNSTGSNKWAEVLKVFVSNSSGSLGLRLRRTGAGGTSGVVLTPAKLNSANADLPSSFYLATGAIPGTIEACIAAHLITAGYASILFDEKEAGQPLLLKEAEGITIQQYATLGTGTVDVHVLFRVRDKE